MNTIPRVRARPGAGLRTPPGPEGSNGKRTPRAGRRPDPSAYGADLAYEVLARKWRPKLFSEVVGQAHVTRTLANALQRGRVPHAFLFAGPRGCGKTTTARLLAKALNCEGGSRPEPCNACGSCLEIESGGSFDVREIDGATYTGVDNIRQLQEELVVAPVRGKYRIYIVDEVHMLSTSAFNAFLKTLEEPPDHVKFIFATTELHKVLPTVRSRCQIFRFRRLGLREITAQLRRIADEEGFDVTDEALAEMAAAAEGGLRDGIVLLDQIAAFSEPGERLTAETVRNAIGAAEGGLIAAMAEALAEGDLAGAMERLAEAEAAGAELRHLLDSLLALLREALLISCGAEGDLPPEERAIAGSLASKMGRDRIVRALETLSEADAAMRRGTPQRLAIELSMVRLCQEDKAPTQPAAPTRSKEEKPRPRREEPPAQETKPAKRAPSGGGNPGKASAHGAGKDSSPHPANPDAKKSPSPPQRPVPAGEKAGAADVAARWDEFLMRLKEEDGTTYVRLAKGRLVRVEGGKAYLSFGASGKTALQRLREKSAAAALQRHAESFFGPLSFVLYLEGEAESNPGNPTGATHRDESPLEHPDVKRAIELFAGKIVHVRRGSASNDQRDDEDT